MPPRVIWVIVIVLLLITFPYLYAARAAGSEYVFGGFLLNPLDGNTYLAKMYEGWRGDLLFTLPYTAERGQGVLIYPLYTFLGHLARWSGMSLTLVYHLARLLASVVMLLALWRFLRVTGVREITSVDPTVGEKTTQGVKVHWTTIWAFALAALGLGMGWLVFPFGMVTSDFWVAEAYSFLSAYVNPHFALSLAALLWLLTIIGSKGPERGRFRLWSGLAIVGVTFLLGLTSPFGVVLALVVLTGLFAWELALRLRGTHTSFIHSLSKQAVGAWLASEQGFVAPGAILERILMILVGGAPVLLYDFWVFHADPILAAWNAQNQTLTPPFWDIALALSPALLMALPGAWWIIRRRQANARLLVVWIFTGLLLIYVPFNLQRRFLMGLSVPLAALAGYGLEWLAECFPSRARLGAGVVFACGLPTLILILLVAAFGAQTHDPLIYLGKAESQTLNWIEQHTQTDALILAAPETGLLIPAYTGRRVIYGHPYETVNAEAEESAVTAFFLGSLDDPAAFLDRRQVDYIFYGPREKALGSLPASLPLQMVYNSNGVAIYRVIGGQ